MKPLHIERKSAPKHAGIYLLKISGDILYVGKASNLFLRLSGFHHVIDAIPELLCEAMSLEIIQTPSINELNLSNLEAVFINRLNPCLNQVRPTVSTVKDSHLKLLEPHMPSTAKTVKNAIVKVDHPKSGTTLKSLAETFKDLSLNAISNYTRSDWDLTEEAKAATMIISQAFGIKPGEALEVAADIAVAMIASKIDPENSESNMKSSQDKLSDKFQASQLHTNPRCLKLLEIWMTEPDRPSVESVCLSVLQKIPANCSTIDLAHITHRINATYGEN